MNEKIPRTPFSTPLSGSAKETEIRIRNIMSGPKKRPPVEGDVRYGIAPPDGPEGAFSEYEAYWDDRLAVMAPGGVDIYTVNPEFAWGQDEPWSMWQLEYGETFYADPSSSDELPMPVYFQSLNWLNEHTNAPGGWQIVSLVLNEEKCDTGKRVDCYTLRARSWDGAEDLTADLFFPYEQTGSRRSYDILDHGEAAGETD